MWFIVWKVNKVGKQQQIWWQEHWIMLLYLITH